LVENFDGKVPSTLNELTTLDGVGRKTANVVLAIWFNVPAIAVDTHVHRVSNRLGLSKSNDVNKIEKDLMKQFNKNDWSNLHHLLLLFGRYYCKSQNPMCVDCKFKDFCTYKGKEK
jgi:endonuclease-3